MTDSLNLWQAVCVCDWQSVPDTVCVCHRLSVSVINSLFLLQTVCVCHRQTMSVTVSLCLSQTVCVCQRQYISVTGNLCLSQAVCVWHRHYSWSLIYTWFSPRFIRDIWICPAFKHHQQQLCGPLPVTCQVSLITCQNIFFYNLFIL